MLSYRVPEKYNLIFIQFDLIDVFLYLLNNYFFNHNNKLVGVYSFEFKYLKTS